MNGSLWSAKPFSFSYYAHICVAMKWVESFLSCVVIVECGSQLESMGNGGDLCICIKSLGGFALLWIRKKGCIHFIKK